MKTYEILEEGLRKLQAKKGPGKGWWGPPKGSHVPRGGGLVTSTRIAQIKEKNDGRVPIYPGNKPMSKQANQITSRVERFWDKTRDKWADDEKAVMYDYFRGILTTPELAEKLGFDPTVGL